MSTSSIKEKSIKEESIKEEEKRILKILPILLKKDAKFKDSLYEVLNKVFVKKNDFSQLRDIVKDIGIKVGELAEVQKNSEERLTKLEQVVKELAQAQKKSEERLTRLEKIVEELVVTQKELTQAQKKSEERLTRLEKIVEELVVTQKELTEAQKKSEERLTRLEKIVEELVVTQKELAQAQKNFEERLTKLECVVKELTEAQKKTEQQLQELIKEHKKTRTQLGGLSITVGYILENEAFKALPELLKRDYSIEIETRLKRKYIVDNENKYIEVNIVGEGKRNGKKITIIGEAKAQLSKNDVDDFLRKKIKRLDKIYEEIFPILVTHMTQEADTEEYVKSQGIALYYSYEF